MFDLIISPFQYEFMLNALIIAILISIPASILSCFLVLKGWSLIGDAISHAVLPGIAIAYIFNFPLIIGAFTAGLICSLATGFFKNNSRVKEDTVMGVVFSGMFALGIVIYTKVETNVHLDEILFGNLLGINDSDLIFSTLISLIVILILLVKWKDLLVFCFDIIHAKSIGLNITNLHYGLLVILSLVIVSNLKAVGIILSIALLITPGATGFLVSKDFKRMLVVAVSSTVLSSIFGVLASYYIDSAPAPTIVIFMSINFVLSYLLFISNKIRTTKQNNG
ncbi:MAG: metal ABC transporter permease [Hyphomicrobiales bacterium]